MNKHTRVFDQAIINSIRNGYIDFQLNPESDAIATSTANKITELADVYNWFLMLTGDTAR